MPGGPTDEWPGEVLSGLYRSFYRQCSATAEFQPAGSTASESDGAGLSAEAGSTGYADNGFSDAGDESRSRGGEALVLLGASDGRGDKDEVYGRSKGMR